MFFQQFDEFFLETRLPVVFFLVFDVFNDSIQPGNADTEGAIFGRPRKQTLMGKCLMHHFEEPPLMSCMALAIGIVAGKESNR